MNICIQNSHMQTIIACMYDKDLKVQVFSCLLNEEFPVLLFVPR